MGMVIDGIATSEAIDSSGELLELKGLDISDLVEGRGVLNTEHRGDDAPGYSYLDIIGRIVYAKKLYTRDDCENERQRQYWDEVKLPYLYIKCELFDDPEDGDHAAAKAAAAQIRHYNRRGLPILIRYSVEGSTLVMEDKVIKAAIARRVAATIKPANKTCHSGILEDERAKTDKSKREGSFEGGAGGVVDDEENSLFSKFERPDRMKLGRSYTLAWDPEVDDVTENFVASARKVIDLAKAMEAAPWHYHGTEPSRLSSIGAHGLVPSNQSNEGNVVFSSVDPQEAHGYGDLLLRFRRPPSSRQRPGVVPGAGASNEWLHDQGIAPAEMEYFDYTPPTVLRVNAPPSQPPSYADESRWKPVPGRLGKTIAAGSYNAAPGTLVGGAALQREDLGDEDRRRLISVCKGALRDHDPAVHGPFKTYLKSLLPEASEDFLDRFAELADEIPVKAKLAMLRKAKGGVAEAMEGAAEEPAKPEHYRGARHAGQTVRPREEREAAYQETLARIKDARSTAFFEDDEAAIPPIEKMRRVKPKADLRYGKVSVDPKRGILYVGGTGEGSAAKRVVPAQAWRLYSPADDPKYMDMLTREENNIHHDRAMDNWVTVHRLLRQGKLPSKLIAHTSLYTLMAPNETGPIQDLAYAFFQDLAAKGYDPTKSYDKDEMSDWEKEYGDMAAGQYLPQYMRDHFLSDASGIWRAPTPAEKMSGTVRTGLYTSQPLTDFGGENARLRSAVGKLGLGDKPQPGKWNTAARYAHTHAFLDTLVKQHGTNANEAIYNFLAQKKQDKEHGFGFAIKTARYTGGMLGMGQHVVPDTHFIRHLFGLHPDDPRIGDAKTLFASDSPDREQAMRGVDQWFRQHHPAFEWTRQKMQKRYGEDFGDQATFPAFWLHWTLIAPHDRVRGWPAGLAANEGTDHEVFWNSARNILREYGLPTDPHDPALRKKEAWKHGGTLPARTAHAMKSMEDRFGPAGASLFYYRFLVPILMAPDKPEALYKAELLARLAKGEFSEDSTTPQVIMHKGAAVEPGEIQWTVGPRAGQSIPLVAIGKDYHHVLGEDGSLMKMKAGHPNSRIVRPPKLVRTSTTVDSKQHGHPSLHGTDAQHDILHGVDLARRIGQPKKGVTWRERDSHGITGWYQSAEGYHVFVKPNVGMDQFVDISDRENNRFGPAHREAAFHRLADEFFGLGEHVPATTVFKHPVTGEWLSAQKKAEGEHYSRTSMWHKEALGQMARTGTLDKLALMDMVLGHFDRHTENALIDPNGKHLHLIDNGLAFAPHTPGHPEAFVPNVPEPWKAGNRYNDGAQWYTKPLHPNAVEWVLSLNAQKLAEHMDRLGVPKSERDEAARRLLALKQRIERGNGVVSRGAAYYAPFLKPSKVQYGSPEGQRHSIEERSGLRDPVEG